MLLAASEGRHWRYEVLEHSDGYLVQMRDIETGHLDEEFSTLFRTMPVAFAYAEMSAAFERFAAAELEPADEEPYHEELERTERTFASLSGSLHDLGETEIADPLPVFRPRPVRVLH